MAARTSYHRRPVEPTVMLAPSALAALICVLNGCQEKPKRPNGIAAPKASTSAQPPPGLIAGQRIAIPGGSFTSGTVPGTHNRDPRLEPRLSDVELGPFEVDQLPQPVDPSRPATGDVTREQATALCAQAGGRLCTELEWERACKGSGSTDFSSGDTWNSKCSEDPSACLNDFNVAGLGARREWTASFARDPKTGARRGVVRGAPPAAESSAHRCAHRTLLPADAAASDLVFRCCYGAPNAAEVPEAKEGETFTKLTLSSKRLQDLLSSDPRTEALGRDVLLFKDPDAAETVIARGPGDRMGFEFTVAPMHWNPVAGAEFLVLTGRSGETTSFVLVYHQVDDDRYNLASSFIMRDEPGPVAIAYSQYIRPRFHFSTCWGCPGETGKILYRDPDSAVILQP